MLILAIETSCDETSAAVVRGDREILSNVVLSQDKVHAPYGGIVPELASRQHIKSISSIVQESLTRAKIKLEKVDVFAVTQGPGLIGSLLVGLSFAKGLAYYFRKPLIGVNHLEAHIEAAFLENPGIALPALALLVSGGHTSLFYLEKRLGYRLLGKTRDDAAGESLDKVAKFLDLGYPGGPVIEKLASGGDPDAFAFAKPRMTDRSLDYSFSGLKTAALRHIRETSLSKTDPRLADFLASYEEAVCRTLLDNMESALEGVEAGSLILCGGVARNKRLRDRFLKFARASGVPGHVPSPKLCTDNAAMVGGVALEKLKAGIVAAPDWNLDAYPR